MRFLDVCRNPAAHGKPDHPIPYLLIVQGNHVEVAASRVVVPLMRRSAIATRVRDIMPTIEVGGEPLVAMTPQIGAVPAARIGAVVASASGVHSEIHHAIDVLTGDL